MLSRITRRKGFITLLLSLSLITHATASELAPEGTRERKFQRGLLNTVFAPVEISHALERVKKKDTWVPSWFSAGFQGCVAAATRAATGVYEILTAPIPSPPNYRPIYHPEFALDYLKPPADEAK